MPKIWIDKLAHDVKEGNNLLQTCLSLGFDLPYFCWHPSLGSVGACRQCAVKQFKDEGDTRGKIVMSCMTPAIEGARISIEDPEARAFRASVIEWLMVNHPHDCPVCDEGGECHLQDVTVMTGHAYRRFRFKKRTFRNQDLGPLVNHEMNRCIACYRCVRFYRDYAGGHDLNVFSTHDHVYFGRHEDGVLENEFSGNLVEVCPTGVFTDKTLKKHYARKWDLQTAPSVCAHCSVGCNTIPGERYGTLRRVRNRYHPEINGYFLCDRGRFGYEFVNGDGRIRDAWIKNGRSGEAPQATRPVTQEEALASLGRLLAKPGQLARTIGIGSPRASLEANFALRKLVGPERFHAGVSENERLLLERTLEIFRTGPVFAASLGDVESSDAVLILGEDVTQTAPRLALSLRQSVRNDPMKLARDLKIPDWQDAAVREAIQERKGPLFVASSQPTRLDDIATDTYRAAPDDIARLGQAVAHVLDPAAPDAPDLPDPVVARANAIARALLGAKKPVIVAGMGSGSEAVLKAAANVAWALHRRNPETRICLTGSEANSLGLALMDGRSLKEAFEAMDAGDVDTVIVAENDLFRRAAPEVVKSFLAKAKQVILIDHTATAMVARSTHVLPATTTSESTGTLVNHEGRAQRHYQVFIPASSVSRNQGKKMIQETWRWSRDLVVAAGRMEANSWRSLDDVIAAMAEELPAFRLLPDAAPNSQFRLAGSRIPRQSHRHSGRTAEFADLTVHEPKPPSDLDSPLAFSMEGYEGEPPGPLIPRYWAPKWNSVQALNKFQSEIGGALPGGPWGQRLIGPSIGTFQPYYGDVPRAFVPKAGEGEWLAVPIHHIFGSEELSRLSPSIAKLAPMPYFGLRPEDAIRLGVHEGESLSVSLRGLPRELPALLIEGLAPGVIGIPIGLPGMEGADIDLPALCRVSLHSQRGAA